MNKLSRNTPEDLSSWPVLTECCYPSFDCLVNPNHQNSGDGTFFKWMHQIQSPTSFAEAHGVFAPLQIHTRRGKCMFKHHTGSTGGCKSMPTTSRQQKVMPKAGLNRVMLTLHALAKTCWKLWRCLLTEKWHAYKLPQENTERWYVDTNSLQFYFRISNMYLLSLLSLFAFMRKHTTYLKKIIYTLTSLYL